MAVNHFIQNRQDASLQVTRALTAADGSVTSGDLNIGTAGFPQAEGWSFGVRLPLIATALLAAADTITIELLNGAAATPTTVIATKVVTGTSADTPAQTVRLGVPRDAGAFFAVKFTTAGTTGDMSGLTATCGPLF